MTASKPIRFNWDGESMTPHNQYFAGLADNQFVVGETYVLEEFNHRSTVSHNHQFAWLHDAWANLPESLAGLYPTAEHLRKRALIDCGFYDETIIDCGSDEAALNVCTHLKRKDDFALVFVSGPYVIERVAKSQSKRAMGAKLFQESKQAILDHIAALIGVAPETLKSEGGKAA